MKHRFLLDENILHHAVKGVDAYDNPDLTAAQFVRLVGDNCHILVLNRELLARYWRHLQALLQVQGPALQPLFFVRQLLANSDKRTLEYADPPELPPGVTVPLEDTHIVRAALLSRPLVVSADEDLLESISTQPSLSLTAKSPGEALHLASEQ